LLPAVRNEPRPPGGVVPDVERQHDPVRSVAMKPAPELVGIEDGEAADHHPRDTEREEGGELVLRPDAATDLQRDSRHGGQTRDHLPVRRRAVARAVKVDDMQSSGACTRYARARSIGSPGSASRRRSALAREADATSAAQIDGGISSMQAGPENSQAAVARRSRSAPGGTACHEISRWITAANSTPYSQVASAVEPGAAAKPWTK
jgi:hypothetical protein